MNHPLGFGLAMKRIIISIWLFLAYSLSTFALSEAELDSITQQFRLDEITISARVVEKDIIQPQTLSGEELHQMNALNVADAIRYFSGVQLKDYGGVGGIKTINVRSMGTNHMGVYYNGVQLGNAQNGQIDLGKFSLDNLEEIQLFNGQKSDIFQSAKEFGNAGCLYLTTRKPYFKAHERVRARVQMRCGSFALANPSFSTDVKLSENMSISLNGEYLHSSGAYKFRYRRVTPNGEVAYDTTAIRQNGDVNAIRAEAGLNHYYSNTGFWRINFYGYYSERGVPGAIVNNVWRNGERLWDRNLFAQGTWQDEFFNRWRIRLNFKYANDYTHYINKDARLLPTDNEYLQQEAYVSIVNKVEIMKWWDIACAYDMQYNHLSKFTHAERYMHYVSLATAMNILDYIRLQASVLATIADNANEEKVQAKFTPGMFISYKPTKLADFKINAFYKQSYRFPTFNDLYYTDIGNANLKPELAKQHDIGLSYNLPFVIGGHETLTNKEVKTDGQLAAISGENSQFSINADYYYNRIANKIIAYPRGQQFRWTMLNLGDVSIHGVDVNTSLNIVPIKGLCIQTKLQYTYQKAIDITSEKDSYYMHQIPYIPLHSGSAILGVSWHNEKSEYGINYSFVYVGERYSQQENIIYNYVQPWYTHDLNLFASWQVKGHELKANVEINNLLGQDYEVISGYPMPKQNVRCTFSISY